MQFLNYDNEKPIECGFDRVKGGWQMRYFSVAEMAKKWDVSERSVRNYCAHEERKKDDAIGYFAG